MLKRKLSCLLALAGVVSLSGTAIGVEPKGVRIAAFNVEFGRSTTPEQVAAALESYELDLVGFNEVPGGDWTARVGRLLGMPYAQVGGISSANHKDKYKSVLSRTPFIETSEHELTAKVGWNPASVVRVVTDVRGQRLAFYSLHIAHSGREDGHAHQLVSRVLAADREPVIVLGGDFNSETGDAALGSLEEAGFHASWRDLPEFNATRPFTYNALQPERSHELIDHLFYRAPAGAKAVAGGVIQLAPPLSDHHPVWSEIVVKRDPSS
jgi:maltose 6'-phosphate phosphatase